MKKTLLLFIVSFSIVFVQAQNKKEFQSFSGKYIVQYYANNIIKVTYKPPDYNRNENISDAVLLKPMNKFGKHHFKLIEGALDIFYRDTELVIDNNYSAGYWGFQMQLKPDEMIFGGGERALPLNRRGYRLDLYNSPHYGYVENTDNLNYSVPFITSSKGYGLFFDNPSKGYLDIGKSDKNILEYGASSGEINVYVIFGNYQQILQSYYKLTGTQPLPPRWAFGNLMSRFGYTSEAQVKDILQKMRNENIPVDAVIFDLFWFGDSIKHTLGNLEWMNKSKWPDPKKMIGDFKKDGIQTILVTEPFFVETSKNYQASKKYLAVDSIGKPYYLTDFYFGRGGLIDIFRKDSRQWFWQFYKKQMNNGVEAWWGDLGEPEKHPSNMYHNMKDYGYKRLFKSDEVHNMYCHTWTKMLYDFYAKEYPNKRLFSLNRSGFASSQRYSIFPWTGDVSRSWSGLRAQLPILLGMSMSGVPYVHSDAGGFAEGEGDNELYVRWLQFAAFTPIFRPHGTALYDVEPGAFSFPSEAALIDTPFINYAKDAISLRYLFMPYNYTLAYQQTKYGKPLISPLYYYFTNDTTAIKIEDEYMWGENVLVAPVLTKGATTRKYYLPKGNWYDGDHSGFIKGGDWHTDSVALSEIPIFYKEGGFLSLNPFYKQNLAAYKADSLFLVYILSDKPSTFELYNDDGITKNAIQKKIFELIKFSSTGISNNKLKISISPNKGNFSGKLLNRTMYFFIYQKKGKPSKVLVGDREFKETKNPVLSDESFIYTPDGKIGIKWKLKNEPATIDIFW